MTVSVYHHNERRKRGKQWQKMKESPNTDTHHYTASYRDMSGCSQGVTLSTFDSLESIDRRLTVW